MPVICSWVLGAAFVRHRLRELEAVCLHSKEELGELSDPARYKSDAKDSVGPCSGTYGSGTFLVVDLPINTPDGLGLAGDLEAGQMIAFGLAWRDIECAWQGEDYRILGVEFFESETAALSGATIEEVGEQNCWCGHPPPP